MFTLSLRHNYSIIPSGCHSSAVLEALCTYSSLDKLASNLTQKKFDKLREVSILDKEILTLEKLEEGQVNNSTEITTNFKIVPCLLLLSTILPIKIETDLQLRILNIKKMSSLLQNWTEIF